MGGTGFALLQQPPLLRTNLFMLYTSPGWSGSHCVDEASPELRDPPASPSQLLDFKNHTQPVSCSPVLGRMSCHAA